MASALVTALTVNDGGPRVAVVQIDVGGLDELSEVLGERGTREVLRAIAVRIVRSIPNSARLFRVAHARFVLLLHNVRDTREAMTIAADIGARFSLPIKFGSREYVMRVAIGVAASGQDGTVEFPEDLMRNAELATAEARGGASGTVAAFQERMLRDAARREQLGKDLDSAVARGELVLHYQPIVDLHQQRIVGAEALARWQHPLHGLIPPDEFIPIAERTGHIAGIGRWVLAEAVTQVAKWGWGSDAPTPRSISVNVSGQQLTNPGFVDFIASVLTRSALVPFTLVLEITETVLMEDGTRVLEHLHALRDLGVRIALDDFGTGYSSMSRLATFPVDVLKIDGSFVTQSARGDRTARALMRSMASLCSELEIIAVAERIESEPELEVATETGCRFGQGFLLGRPLPAGRFAQAHAFRA